METKNIFVVSDSTGETAERLTRAAMLQFPGTSVRVRLHTRIRDKDGVRQVMQLASERNALVVFTIVAMEVREFLLQCAQEMNVEAVDVIGALIAKLSAVLEAKPIMMPTATLPLTEEYFRRVEAIEFAVKSDDGKEPRNLRRADLILVGVSRTSKTPLSSYIAGRGVRVANVPIVLGVPPPPELFEAPHARVVGLVIGLDQLLSIRQARLRQLGMPPDTNYGLREHVKSELDYAQNLFEQNPAWHVVDVTGRAIEETATIILEHLKEREDPLPGSRTTPAK